MRIASIVGDNIRGFRSKKRWTQARLGEECGSSGNYIGEIEREETRVTVEKLFDIAKALKVKPHYFFVEGAYRKTPTEIERILREG
ncbi:MAG: helix-turn-helix transcriptional regulator [Bacteroidetes bacterium]|jgi:transcriptional regulator with XRE-family HTH domain|nr:helix-turn-helix transcriptional regulator [Bacteroidota bacterium]